MAALAGYGAPAEVKAPKAPPALFPKFVVEEPGDFPCLKSPPPDKIEKLMIGLQRSLKAQHKASIYCTKPPTQEKDVERFSDALKRDEQATLEAFLHTRSRYLPHELRAEPLASSAEDFGGGIRYMDLEELVVGDMLPLSSLPAELSSDFMDNGSIIDFAPPPPQAKRKRVEDEAAAKQLKKKQKKEDTKKKKKDAAEEKQAPELDFANLLKHKLVELRDFCREKSIVVSSRNKQGYADAITAWKKKQPAPKPAVPAPKAKEAEVRAVVNRAGPSSAEKGKEKEVETSEKAAANGGTQPRPLDRMSRLVQLEEEIGEDEEEDGTRINKRRPEDEDEEEENDYNERYGSDGEGEEGDDDGEEEPTF